MDLKNRLTTVFILFLLFAIHPAVSTGRLKLRKAKLNPEIYEIDYRGPETHPYMPPPNRSGGGNTNVVPLQNPKANARFKSLSTENATNKVKKVHE